MTFEVKVKDEGVQAGDIGVTTLAPVSHEKWLLLP